MSGKTKLKGLYLLAPEAASLIYGPEERREIADWVDFDAPLQTRDSIRDNPDILNEAEVIFSGWGMPVLDRALLHQAPNLKAIFYGAGGTGGMIHPDAWERGILVTTAAAANAVPVAEFTLASIILTLKNAFRFSRQIRETGGYPERSAEPVIGTFGATVGLVSLGAIGRAVAERVRTVLPEITLLASDPFVADEEMQALGVCPTTLEDLFRRSDVVSLHTPWLPETEGMIRGSHIASMKTGATLLNTARGAIIAEEEMIAVLARRPDLTAILDVTHPEPPLPDSPLYTLPNVFLTPHIAGSQQEECRRMGRLMVEELRRYCTGQPLLHAVHPNRVRNTIHRLPLTK